MPPKKTVVTVISKISERPSNATAALVVIHGHELGRKYDLGEHEIVIGRSSKAHIQVDQEAVSRTHAKVVSDGQGANIEDLGSTNGTWVNDEAITGKFQLRNGDLIKIGRSIFKFIAGGNIEAAYHEEIYRLTTIDGLTQIFNRRYFEETLEREVSRCHRYRRDLTLLLIDIDHFKRINDRFGHLAGDFVLRQLASTVRTRIRREDIFARYGGEEFALLLPEIDAQGGLVMAEKCRQLVEGQLFHFDHQDIPVTISVGLASLGGTDCDGAELVRRADEKLYAAKKAGRNRVSA